jgi:ferritin-like metal-binding protein YciE
MSKIANLQELYIEQLKDLHHAERQLFKALPKMAKAASDSKLVTAFQAHLGETEKHAAIVEAILTSHDESPGRKKCAAMEGLIKEGAEMIAEHAPDAVKDAGLIASAQRVEHYEIAGYGCVRTFACLLGHNEDAQKLQAILDQEGAADKKLTSIAEKLNIEAKTEY